MAQIAAMYPAKQLTTLKHIPRTIAGQEPCSIKKIIAMKEQLAHSANQAPRHAPHCATLLRLSSALLDTATSPCIAPLWGLNCPKVVELELCPNTEVEHHFVPDKTEETLKKEIFIFFFIFPIFRERQFLFFYFFVSISWCWKMRFTFLEIIKKTYLQCLYAQKLQNSASGLWSTQPHAG